MRNFTKNFIQRMLAKFGYHITRVPNITDKEFYSPLFSPVEKFCEFKSILKKSEEISMVSGDRFYILFSIAMQAVNINGEWYECGVYKGGTALLLAGVLSKKRLFQDIKLHLFDTFEGMPDVDEKKDLHSKGDFGDTTLEKVKSLICGNRENTSIIEFHKGLIPDTFKGLEKHKIAMAHIDVDIYQSILDCCSFIYPRLQAGGFIVFDDYGFPSCPGARKAVDEYFEDKPEFPLILPTGQAIVFKTFTL